MYSQNLEEEIILNYFGKNFTGTFLDLGSNDGITLSNTFALAKEGWSGCCIEASPKAYDRLKAAHPFNKDIEYYKFAIGTQNGKIKFYESDEHLKKGDIALLSTAKESELQRWVNTQTFTEIEVNVRTFKTFLSMTTHNHFHFISIDIEGMELEVLPQMDLKALDCRLLCVEWNSKDKDKFDSIILPQGFKLMHSNAENLIYYRLHCPKI